jgi:4'-phosphopantetheinyl transferase
LDLQVSQVLNLQRSLSEDELARVQRLHFQKDRDRFIVARGLLRIFLAHYLGAQPAQLRFCYGLCGKPRLAMSGAEGLRFSVSHSQGLALFAVTSGRQVGIDLEAIRPHPANEDVAEKFFTLRELALLRALPQDARQEAFFAFWTRKEAYAKAGGEGLTIPLKHLDVSFLSGEPTILLGTRGHPQEASRWSIRDLKPGAGFAGAIAVEGRDWKLECWE